MPLIEEIPEAEVIYGQAGPSSTAEMTRTLRQLASRLAVPQELLSSYVDAEQPAAISYQQHALEVCRQFQAEVSQPTWSHLELEEQGETMYEVLRLYSHDAWTSAAVRAAIDNIASYVDRPAMALHLLQTLRPIFSSTPHPMLNETTSRALSRPAGGSGGQSDFHDTDTQTFKRSSAWGCHNVLGWAAANLPPNDVEKRIGLILPPTLVLMDDWEPHWRLRGIRVLDMWMDEISPETMRRMGIDTLLRSSITHTMGLHASPPLRGVFPVALRLVKRTTDGKARADAVSEIMDKGIIQGWTYAPSGVEGREVLISIAGDLELLCAELGQAVVRWIKYIPTPLMLPHYRANLSALKSVLIAIRGTGRSARWRGQILDVVSRLWVQLDERGSEDLVELTNLVEQIQSLVRDVVQELSDQVPALKEDELAQLVKLDEKLFRPMLQAT